MDVGAIADASIAMNLSNVQHEAGTAVLRKSLDAERAQGTSLIQCLQESVPPADHLLDVLV